MNLDSEDLKLFFLAILMVAALVYLVKNVFQCYFKCKKRSKSGKGEATFQVGIRGDEPSSSSSSSPQRSDQSSDPPTPPQELPEEYERLVKVNVND
jgi:hypothetical protein